MSGVVMQESFSFSDELNRYTRKCRQHLRRVFVFRDVIFANAPNFQKETSLWFQPKELFDADGTIAERFHRSVNDSHFLLLKVNFEFYLARTLCLFWDEYRQEIVRNSFQRDKTLPKSVKLPNQVLLSMACNGDWSGLPCGEDVVPSHGLNELATCFREFVGRSLQELVQLGKQGTTKIASNVDPWSQIHCAFQVRHLIEHRNGRVDGGFLRNSQKHLEKSTWQDLTAVENPESGTAAAKRIRIRDLDIEQTYWAMDASLDGIRDALLSNAVTNSST